MTLGAKPGPVTQTDRLMTYYRDLETGRFTVIADFEQTRHMELFRSVSTAGMPLHRLSLTSGIEDTGGRCLRVAFSRPRDELIADGIRARRWALARDWRDYDLLLMNVHAPGAVDLQLSLVSGEGQARSVADSRIPLRRGWNLLRLDLADAAANVALDDIREVRWSLPDVADATVVLIDDVILTHNRADLFGDSSADDGGLYVRRRGRRWDLGVGGRFELGLINGQIKYWYDLAADPLRVRNLVADTALGPTVVTVTGDPGSEPEALEGFGDRSERVAASQRLLEASNTRIVVACTWEFLPTDATADLPAQKWTYSLYPSGELYVHVQCTTQTRNWTAGNLGLTVSQHGGAAADMICHSTSQPGDAGRLLHVPYAFLSNGEEAGRGLLFVVHDGRSAPVVECVRRSTTPQLTAVAFGGETQKPLQQWDCLLALGLSGTGARETAAVRAVQYCFPPVLSPSLGSLVTDSAGDGDQDGFNERFGCYVLAPDANRIRLRLEADAAPLYGPAFLVRGSAGMEAWVYVDYVILEGVSRTADGEVLFQLPGVVNHRRIVEVYLRNAPG